MSTTAQSETRLYRVARCLCAAFFVNVCWVLVGVSRYFPALPVLLALAAIFFGLAFPRLPAGRRGCLVHFLVFATASIHLLGIWLWLHFVCAYFTLNIQFRAMVRDADRVVIRDGGGLCHSDPDNEPSLYEITNKTEIAEFNRMFRFSSQTMRCRCCGYPGVDWWRDGKRIAVSAIHHGIALRIEGKSFDWHLSPHSQKHLKEWLDEHCKIRSKDGYPMYRQCFENRGYLEMEAWDWPKANGGRKPGISDLSDSAKKKRNGDRDLSCPAGGEYSLSFDENGAPYVSCTIPRHD